MHLVLILVLLGPPGSGKSTQAALLGAEHRILTISTGELLRDEVARATKMGLRVKATLARGELVDDAIVNELVSERIARPDCARGFVLDGYPRTLAQAQFLDRLLGERKLPPPTVIELDVPDAALLARLDTRGRSDDTHAAIARRLRSYRAELAPLVAHYRGRNFHRVDGNKPPAEVQRAIEAALSPPLSLSP